MKKKKRKEQKKKKEILTVEFDSFFEILEFGSFLFTIEFFGQ